ncbi:S9 family peptidase [Kribbella pittospori]|uniref:S9 family peptidase n=1 Tax=Kribbella pittospori TaxID=722689 RepID=A0A4R0KRI5_9ACTN|nr:S9 family peptidase [Kribbella pittospori]
MDSVEAFPGLSARTGRFTLGLPRAFTLSPDGERVLFLRTRGAEDRTGCLWLLDVSDGQEILLVAPENLGDDGPVPEAELVRRERSRERTAGVVAYSTDRAVRHVVFAVKGDLYQLDLDSPDRRPELVPTAGPVVDPRIDPSGRRVAYVTGRALHVVELADGNDRRLAADPDPEVAWGLPEHVAAESMQRNRGHWWSPDGTRLLAARVDQTPVQRWWIADPANPGRKPREIAYPAAGTPNAIVTLHAFDLSGGSVEVRWDRVGYEYLTSVGWDSRGPLIGVQARDQRTLQVLAADPESGETRLVHEQSDPAWVELIAGTPARTESGRLVHTEDAGETRRLTVGGEAVTPDGLQVRAVLDVSGEAVLFEANDEPTERHLWLYDETGLRKLSEGAGIHTRSRVPGALLMVSNTESGRWFVVQRDGRPDQTITALNAKPGLTPRITWLRAGELQMRTALLLPSWYQPGDAPLPVLMSPYGGSASQLAVRVTGAWFATAQWYAEAGFAVIIADGRGTPGRGPVWEKAVHLDTMTAPLEDQVTALHSVAEQTGALDLTKVAMRGWSYGGLLSAAAVLRRPDVFHAAIAGAAPSDSRMYDTHWRERFLGHPGENPEVYDRSSLLTYAAGLDRPLLLVHGLADDNVVAAHTLRLSAALLAAGRQHQVLPLSGATHMPTDAATVEGLMLHELRFLNEALGL